ncbi:MAG TPA: HNH endonuclease signature motif containing protein [Solirubrobacteraceae bacterium]|nr:HNH endonuclease signature motif containing protein [Solirubrobacteraceae bacterium]
MLHEAKNADFVATRSLVRRRYRFVAGPIACERSLSRRAYAEQGRMQVERPVAVAAIGGGRRRYWWFRGRFWWEDGGLDEGDVMALVLERERRVERRLERARALMAGGVGAARQGIPLEAKRAVWERCGGRCVECGADSLLEFDHVIPLAMGGSDGERNLQLLCAECNRGKGASL